ncbi:MAG: sensor histidine kinase KdpD [Deltaproteobacteria bacterium]|nr:sensor histidine kinase KdpD [Deltaproteobacteria bacterium]
MARGDDRPDPDALLERVRAEESASGRGRLTIFFGAAPGVGKTYAMLEAARLEREEGRDVVVGVVETHGRYDTGALLLGLEILARRKVDHRGVKLEEMDLDAALVRRPALLLVDELAHTNAPGSRHAKRWQDVEEILDAGIDVYTTLNVQHVESLNDLVARITHVVVRETVPDIVLEKADDVRVIDLPIDELLQRLREGKVYLAEQARRAKESFFREGNLIALRELALRLTAERVDAQMRRYREAHGIEGTWSVGERLLVCVSPSPASGPLIRAARRLASSLHAPWIAAYVETPAALRLSRDARDRVSEHLRLAQSLGAETLTLSGMEGPEEIVRFARSRNVSRILVGKPSHSRWRDRLKEPFLDKLVRSSGDIDVHVLSGDVAARGAPAKIERTPNASRSPWGGVLAGMLAVGGATVVTRALFDATRLADVVMVYLLGIILVSMQWGLVPSLTAAGLSVLCVDFFFVRPFYTFAVTDVGHVVTFGVMLLVGVVISGLTKRVRDQADAARERETRTASLYVMSRALAAAKSEEDVLVVGARHVHDFFDVRATSFHACDGVLAPLLGQPFVFEPDAKELGVADWVYQHGKAAGLGTDTLPSASALYLPLATSGRTIGVLGVAPGDVARFAGHDDRRHLETLAGQIAAALERAKLASEAQDAHLRIEREQLRNALLSSVSHDLRTPLAVITGTATTLLESSLDPAVRRDLTANIVTEADRLNRLLRNLLDMTRLEAGAVDVHKEWQPIEEVVGTAIDRARPMLGTRTVTAKLADDLPLVPYDSTLLQQVLVNLLENAAKYTPADSPLEVSALAREGEVEIVLADRGPGIAEGEESRIFEKFYRGEKGRGGVGLGLTICKGIVTAHGGRIWATNRAGGGAAFHFTLPIVGEPPKMDIPESRDERRAS